MFCRLFRLSELTAERSAVPPLGQRSSACGRDRVRSLTRGPALEARGKFLRSARSRIHLLYPHVGVLGWGNLDREFNREGFGGNEFAMRLDTGGLIAGYLNPGADSVAHVQARRLALILQRAHNIAGVTFGEKFIVDCQVE